jgi:hypothetical protein
VLAAPNQTRPAAAHARSRRVRTLAMDLHRHVTTNTVLCVLAQGRLGSDHARSMGRLEPGFRDHALMPPES